MNLFEMIRLFGSFGMNQGPDCKKQACTETKIKVLNGYCIVNI